MRIGVPSGCILIASALTASCSAISARDVVVHGRVSDGSGVPIAGLQVYVADLKHRIISMPGVGEHAYVYTDAEGRYSVTFNKLHSAVSISVIQVGKYVACPGEDVSALAPIIDKSAFAGTHEIQRDLVFCAGHPLGTAGQPLILTAVSVGR
jgi:hypothetical protein